VAYSNAAKSGLLGVPIDLLTAHGAVSEEAVMAMAQGARSRFAVDLAVAVSGIAGPGGGSADKPVGTVHFAWAASSGITAARRIFAGTRDAVRRQTVALALERLVELTRDDERR
jgi:nicotinamide-nucleotide amidase